MKVCKKCGKEYSESLKFCPDCGASLIKEAKHEVMAEPSLRRKISYVLIIFGIIQIVLGLYLFLQAQDNWNTAHGYYLRVRDYIKGSLGGPSEILGLYGEIIEAFSGAFRITLLLWGFPAIFSIVNGSMWVTVGILLHSKKY
jgi:heme/copper-type cytochrome/quinol oxidase subunit 4